MQNQLRNSYAVGPEEGVQRSRRSKGSVVLCSFGLYWAQITLETLLRLQRCDVVFATAFDKITSGPLKGHCKEIRYLEDIFPSSGRDVEELMADKARHVVSIAASGASVGLVTYGHPTFMSLLSSVVIAECENRNISYEVLSAISSLNAVLDMVGCRRDSDMGIGLHVYHAGKLLEKDPAIFDQRAATLIFNLSGFRQYPDAEVKFELFYSRLTEAYPAEHPAMLVRCSCISFPQSHVLETTIRKLPAAMRPLNLDPYTLFLPSIISLRKLADPPL